jgi:hypothetical protein
VKFEEEKERVRNLQHVTDVANKGSRNRLGIYPLTRLVSDLRSNYKGFLQISFFALQRKQRA